jgi:hypothetical protein
MCRRTHRFINRKTVDSRLIFTWQIQLYVVVNVWPCMASTCGRFWLDCDFAYCVVLVPTMSTAAVLSNTFLASQYLDVSIMRARVALVGLQHICNSLENAVACAVSAAGSIQVYCRNRPVLGHQTSLSAVYCTSLRLHVQLGSVGQCLIR